MHFVEVGLLLLSETEEGYVSFSCPLDKFCGQSDFMRDILRVR